MQRRRRKASNPKVPRRFHSRIALLIDDEMKPPPGRFKNVSIPLTQADLPSAAFSCPPYVLGNQYDMPVMKQQGQVFLQVRTDPAWYLRTSHDLPSDNLPDLNFTLRRPLLERGLTFAQKSGFSKRYVPNFLRCRRERGMPGCRNHLKRPSSVARRCPCALVSRSMVELY